MDDKLAIEAALDCRWHQAIQLNSKIIKSDPANIDALNRMAHAYFETGNYKLAKKYYSQVLNFDPYNPIAIKNLKMLQAFKKSNGNGGSNTILRITASVFLQEPGKTKLVSLLKVAEPQKLSLVSPGCPAIMLAKNRGITVIDGKGGYLGVLPDDISFTLIRLMKGGNKYEAVINSVRVNGLTILIRETFRSSKFRNQPSFLEFSPQTLDLTPTLDTEGTQDLISEEEES